MPLILSNHSAKNKKSIFEPMPFLKIKDLENFDEEHEKMLSSQYTDVQYVGHWIFASIIHLKLRNTYVTFPKFLIHHKFPSRTDESQRL